MKQGRQVMIVDETGDWLRQQGYGKAESSSDGLTVRCHDIIRWSERLVLDRQAR